LTGYLLDTNIPSEFSRARPEPRVVQWLETLAVESLFVSAVTIGEIRRGLAVLPDGQRRARLEAWFQDRILPVTRPIAERWGVSDAQASCEAGS
jgi:predicted nucleic acid-binding protein